MTEDRILYHYTSVHGAHAILSSLSVWMSDCRYLNDRDELEKAIELFCSAIPEKFQESVKFAFDWVGHSRRHCVLSLSESPKILSQWRAYGDDGKGFSLGFSKKFLTSPLTEHHSTVVSCVYDDHEEFIKQLVESVEPELEEINAIYEKCRKAVNAFWGHIDDSPEVFDKLFSELLRIKNPAFREEQEWRLVKSIAAKDAKSRVSGNVIVPYISNHLWVDEDPLHFGVLLREIWLGPLCDDRNSTYLESNFHIGLGQNVHKYDCGYR